jgi:hypothetical protein
MMRWKFGQKLGDPSCPYLIRWVFDFYLFSIRIHHWLASDDQRNMHDHPWGYVTFVIRGGYTDVNPNGRIPLPRWSLRKFPATHQHTTLVNPGGAWTILLTGRDKREWGFWVNGRFRKRNKYFYMFGHHQCEK